MSFLSRIGKDTSRFDFDILVHSVDGVPTSDQKFFCTCKRGSKAYKTKSKPVIQNSIQFSEVLSFRPTLYVASQSSYMSKKFDIFISQSGSKSSPQLKGSLDLADFATCVDSKPSILALPLVQDKKRAQKMLQMTKQDITLLRLTIRCRYVSGSKLRKPPKAHVLTNRNVAHKHAMGNSNDNLDQMVDTAQVNTKVNEQDDTVEKRQSIDITRTVSEANKMTTTNGQKSSQSENDDEQIIAEKTMAANSMQVHFLKYAQFTEVKQLSSKGNFGLVYQAILGRKEVVIKVPRQKQGSSEWSELFSFLDLPPHPNVLPLLGVCRDFQGLKYNAFCLVTELEQGSLRDLLASMLEGLSSVDREYTLLRMALDMATGLAHLHDHDIVHGDIALRNFLVAHDGRVLVCDFGLSRSVNDLDDFSENSTTSFPVRWMSPEALLSTQSTPASDVWMYGVALWELMNIDGHALPYSNVKELIQVVRGVIDGSLRLSPPPVSAPQGLIELMHCCCAQAPTSRPSFHLIMKWLNQLLKVDADNTTADDVDYAHNTNNNGLHFREDKEEAVDIRSVLPAS